MRVGVASSTRAGTNVRVPPVFLSEASRSRRGADTPEKEKRWQTDRQVQHPASHDVSEKSASKQSASSEPTRQRQNAQKHEREKANVRWFEQRRLRRAIRRMPSGSAEKALMTIVYRRFTADQELMLLLSERVLLDGAGGTAEKLARATLDGYAIGSVRGTITPVIDPELLAEVEDALKDVE